MSFVSVVPEWVAAAATDAAGIGSVVGAANAAAAGATTSVTAAAGDEVSVAIAAVFGGFGRAPALLISRLVSWGIVD
ncbi:PE domain-containing protein [Mycobacterium pseudoshottsii]|uniref:PE domain-containing protein n=1 Tax=Mycobacterium pseudoshottsii TaxID=265949 RepID=A0A9N7LRC8_9MYCO|nr:hypothetical protein MPSD_14740 [Mycobacterium pseudoshottsii JCM 15466]BDN81238.1 hypothetical protein NJB1907Z4_C14530 [Mycobacterium pseudoshottsii]GAQ31895.1 hypothetical protein MPS_0275 [Mycobacterium pseudoshottsii JCM 15466]